MKYIDVHSHWTDLRVFTNSEWIKEALAACREREINFFLLGGTSPSDWQRQIQLSLQFPNTFGKSFGLHPYFVSENDEDECEKALDELTILLGQAMAIGETGLDFRPHIVKDKQYLQIEMFENQIELAKAFQKPLVLHIVQAHDKAIQVFDIWTVPERTGFVHAFNGSFEVAKKYIDRGFLISIGGAVTFDKNRKLQDCIKKLPLEYLLIESDSPDQPPEGWGIEFNQKPILNNSASIYKVAEKIGLIRNLSVFDVLEINTANFKRLFRI